MKRLLLLTSAIALSQAIALQGRTISDYIDWGPQTHNFPEALKTWQPGTPFTADDNFFISRVRPRARFTNLATQVHPEITPDIDKNLIYWVPIGTPPDNALPSGNFDSDMFSMWSYVTHFGNWSTQMARIPGNFSDAAHRNGVGVSPVLGIPWGNISNEWSLTLRRMMDVGPEKMSDFLEYYGIDGLGYNSEFALNKSLDESQRPKSVDEISAFNAALVRIAAEKGRPAFMNIWYDGTSDGGTIMFDRGLASHNYNTFGDKDNLASSLFFNYNWNTSTLLQRSADNANAMGRSPLDLYVGFNMQGGEPKKTLVSWTLLQKYPLSIGLWGAHSESMMYESRRELGATPLAIQQNYLNRTEWWFSGGSRNPANAPAISDAWNYSGENTGFFGMARLMSARSTLTEPFVTNFNLGNGRFFNFNGERRSNDSWANIGMQDILPTWRFWWSGKLLGGNAGDVPHTGLDASFVWDDAWLGGSCLKIAGTVQNPEYLHLFKTSIDVNSDASLFVRYKHLDGSGNMNVVLTAEGEETVEIEVPTQVIFNHPSEKWHLAEFKLADVAPGLVGKKISLVAFRFNNAQALDMRLGAFGIVEEAAQAPATPLITRTELLAASTDGIDGKIIWEMPDGQTKRYNDEQGVSFFQLYYQQEGGEPVMQSGTSSWAGLILDGKMAGYDKNTKVRFGVAAVGLDFATCSDIAWGEWHEFDSMYVFSHDITSRLLNNEQLTGVSEVYPGTEVVYEFRDPIHPESDWNMVDGAGNVVASKQAATSFVAKAETPGFYKLTVSYKDADGQLATEEYPNMLCVLDPAVAAAPQITDFRYELEGDDKVHCYFAAEPGSGRRSRGLVLDGKPFGLKTNEVTIAANRTWGLSFWLRPDAYHEDETHLISVRDKTQAWSKNEWGFLWSTVGKDGNGIKISIRKVGDTGSYELRYDDVKLTPGVWTALGFSFAYNSSNQLDFGLYVDGKKVEPNSYKDNNGVEHEGAPAPFGQLYAFSKGNVISVGGTLFKTGGVEGAIDNFAYWMSDLDEGRAAEAMGDIDPANPPAGMDAFFSFEQDADENHNFVNEISSGKHPNAKSGRFMYVPQLTEGSGVLEYMEPSYCAGSPQLDGETSMKTKVIWTAPGAAVTRAGDASKGDAVMKYWGDGVYKIKLRVENPCGFDEKEINMISVPCTGVDRVDADQPLCRRNVMISSNGMVALNFESAGEYAVEVLTIDGRLVKKATVNTAGGRYLIDSLPTQTPLVVLVK